MSSLEQLQVLIENEKINVNRLVCELIDATHSYIECVVLLGPRQVGKTTLAKTIYESKFGGVYRDLERRSDREDVGYGQDFFKRHKRRMILLDEIQECEYLFPEIKVHIDEQRYEENEDCKFVLLGSASLDLQVKTVASLTGRVAFREMSGILLSELIDALSDKIEITSDDELAESYKNLTVLLMLRGGMPQSLFAKSGERSRDVRTEFIDSYVQNDVLKYGLIVDRVTLQDCLEFIALVNGSQFEIGTYTTRLKTSGQKVQDAMSALRQMLLLRIIKPWKEINGKSVTLSKHTKVYIRDTGLLSSLLDIDSPQSLVASKHIGAIWEGFVIESLIGIAQSTGSFKNCFYYRTHDGDSELDFIIEFRDRTKWGIEIKYSEPDRLNAGNVLAAETVGVNRRLVIYNGVRRFKLHDGFEAMPLFEALDEVLKHKSRRV